MKEKQPAKSNQQRKLLLVLPLLVLPFVTLAFWALGGGKEQANKSGQNTTGLNLNLPDAKLKDEKNANKLSYYQEADADSLKRREAISNDPYYKDRITGVQYHGLAAKEILQDSLNGIMHGLNSTAYNEGSDDKEHRIYQKIKELNKQINQPVERENLSKSTAHSLGEPENSAAFTNNVDRLQGMMQQVNDKPETDPEMQQLNGTLDKIMALQHPEIIGAKIKNESLKNKQQVYTISKDFAPDNISLLDTGKIQNKTNGFYSLEATDNEAAHNSIEAVVHEAQVLVNGAVVKLRLVNDFFINGIVVTKGNFVFGVAQIEGERLTIGIQSIRSNNALFPVKLEVYDLDGLPGIYIPGEISRDVAKQSADNSLQLMELSSMDPSLKAQVAEGAINATKSLLSKKIKQVKVWVKAGYKVLLRDKNNEQ